MADFECKHEVERQFHEWLSGFSESHRFIILEDWETAFAVSAGRKDKRINPETQKELTFISDGESAETILQASQREHDKDMRQGLFGRRSNDQR